MANETKSAKANRREFVRTNISRAECIASMVILILLVIIGLAIAYKGKHFDPSVYNVSADSLKPTAAAVVGKNVTAPSTAETQQAATSSVSESTSDGGAPAAEPAPEQSSDTPVPAVKGAPMDIALTGIEPMSDTEFYNSDTLYEKIDGRAPAYQSFNVQGLRCRTFSVLASAGSYVDVYEYRFDSPVDAFGMFSLERDPKGEPLDFAPDGYSGGTGYFFRQGAVYVQVIASDQKPATLALTKAIAENRAKALPVDDRGLAGRRKLPATGLMAGSVSYVPENAQGQAAFKDVFQAKYQFDGAELPFFIMVATPDDAAKAWKSFQDFCARFGKVESLPDVSGAKLFSAEVFGKWKVVYQREDDLGGVFDAADETNAQTFVEKYLRGELK